MVIDKKRCATTGSKQTAIVKAMVSQRYGCLRAFGAVPRDIKRVFRCKATYERSISRKIRKLAIPKNKCFPNDCSSHLPGLPTKSQGADSSIWLYLASGFYLPLIRATWQTNTLQGHHILFTSKLPHQFYLSFHLQTLPAGQHQVPACFH